MGAGEYDVSFAEEFAKICNNQNVFNNGSDKVPRPFITKEAPALFQIVMEKTGSTFLIFSDNRLAGEVGISLKDEVVRVHAGIGYCIAEPFGAGPGY